MDEKVLQTLRTLTAFFSQEAVAYHITGGLAGNIFGSEWRLSDIDIEVHFADLARIEKQFSNAITKHTARYVDSEFDIWLLQLNLNGIEVDINAIEDFYILDKDKRTKIETGFQKSKLVEYHGLKVKVQSLEEIIEYKRLLNRKADVEDLVRLLG